MSRTRLTGENYKLSADRDRCQIPRRSQNFQPACPPGAKNLLQSGRDAVKSRFPVILFLIQPTLLQSATACDNNPPKSAYQKKGTSNTVGYGQGRGDNFQPAPSQTQKIKN
jgi:hypothetical protein